MNLIFRTAGAEDLSEIIMLLADDELGQTREVSSFQFTKHT